MKMFIFAFFTVISVAAFAGEQRLQIERPADGKVLILSGATRQEISVADGDRIVVEVRGNGSSTAPTTSPLQKKECKSGYGKTECGYNCVVNYGKILCSDHPDKKCLLEAFDGACGYDCKAGMGKVKCAKTPQGTCAAEYGEVKCVD